MSLGLTETRDGTPSPAVPQARTYWLTRFVILRLLGVVYLAAFLSLALQVLPLIGADGLLPATAFLARVATHFDGGAARFFTLPTVFWLGRRRPRARRRRVGRRRRLARRRARLRERAHDGARSGRSISPSSTSGRTGTATAGRFSSSRPASSRSSSARSSTHARSRGGRRRYAVIWPLSLAHRPHHARRRVSSSCAATRAGAISRASTTTTRRSRSRTRSAGRCTSCRTGSTGSARCSTTSPSSARPGSPSARGEARHVAGP